MNRIFFPFSLFLPSSSISLVIPAQAGIQSDNQRSLCITKLFLTLLTMLLISNLAMAKPSQYTNLTKPITLKAGGPHIIKLKLKSNPSTGYSWFYLPNKSNHRLIAPQKHWYIAPDAKQPGMAGTDVWVFDVKKGAFKVPSILKIDLLYKRPWGKVATDKITSVEIITQVPDGR